MASIQFRGIAKTVEAYRYKDIPAFSIWQGKAMIHKFEGDDIEEGAENLQQFLTLMTNESNSVYTLRVYEGVEKIKSNTPDDGSFHFVFKDEEQYQESKLLYSSRNAELMQKIENLEKQISEMNQDDAEDDDDDEPEQPAWMRGVEQIGKAMENPMIAQLVGKFLNIDTAALGKVAGIPGEASEDLLNKALEILKKEDHKLPEHLWKLAQLAQHNKVTFNFLISHLDTMSV